MSDIGLMGAADEPDHEFPEPSEQPAAAERSRTERGGRRALRPEKEPRAERRGRGCLPVLLVLALLAGGLYFAGRWAYDEIDARFGPPADYPGPGTGKVVVEVKEGASSTAIGNELKKAGVVKSVDAFADAARTNAQSRGIQVGFYELRKQMKASQALDVLINPKNQLQSLVVVPEGARVRQVVAAIVKRTDIPKADVTAALKDAAAIGLPPEAEGNPEGYLYPATYSVKPGETALGLIKQMVAKTVAVEKQLDITARAAKLGLTPEEVLTVASILEYEANRDEDYPKVARVLYNRLKIKMALQLDSTVSYVSGRAGDVWTTKAERDSDSLYNTYKHTGLPPGPIGSPGQATIEAALNPAEGNWLYFVPDFANGTTHFTNDYSQHVKWANEAKAFCAKSDKC